MDDFHGCGKQPKTLSGIETEHTSIQNANSSGGKQPKTLSGIETSIRLTMTEGKQPAENNLKPYQGLKHRVLQIFLLFS